LVGNGSTNTTIDGGGEGDVVEGSKRSLKFLGWITKGAVSVGFKVASWIVSVADQIYSIYMVVKYYNDHEDEITDGNKKNSPVYKDGESVQLSVKLKKDVYAKVIYKVESV